jgi:hypothetical protein
MTTMNVRIRRYQVTIHAKASKAPQRIAASELRVYMDHLGGGADPMIQPRFSFLLPL